MAINRQLIQGQAEIAKANSTNPADNFLKGITESLKAFKDEKAKEEIKVDNWLSKIGTPKNIDKIDDYMRSSVDAWVEGKQEKYLEYKESYEKNRDKESKRNFEKIERQFGTLNSQLSDLSIDKQNFATVGGVGGLFLGGLGSDWYVKNYAGRQDATGKFVMGDDPATQNEVEGTFSISEEGRIKFGNDMFDDKKGKWNSKNNAMLGVINKKFVDASNKGRQNGATSGSKENNFDIGNARITYREALKNQNIGGGPAGIVVLGQTDLIESDENDLTFAAQWASGSLADESAYDGFKANDDGTYDNAWMQDEKNSDQLMNLMVNYLSNTEETIANDAFDKSRGIKNTASFLDTSSGISTNQGGLGYTATKSLYNNLKNRASGWTAFGRTFNYDPGKDEWIAMLDGVPKSIGNTTEFIDFFNIDDNAFENLKGKKVIPKKGGGSDDPPPPFKLDLSLVTSTVDEGLFQKFEKVAPGFSFVKNNINEQGNKRTLRHDHYIVTAPNGEDLKIHLNRSLDKELTRKTLETFIINNTI